MACYLVCDFGGTKLSAAVIETSFPVPALTWQAHRRVFSPPGADRAVDIRTMMALGHDLLAGRRPTAVGVSFGGPVNQQTGMVYLSHHVPGWEATPLQAILTEAFSAPVRVDNDANVAVGAGAVAGATLLRRLRRSLPPRALVATAVALFAASALALSGVRSVAVAALCFVPAGMGWIGAFSSLQALVQLWTPDAMRARVIALYTMLHFASWGTFAFAGGIVAERFGVPVALAAGAAGCAVAALVTTRLPLPGSFLAPSESP